MRVVSKFYYIYKENKRWENNLKKVAVKLSFQTTVMQLSPGRNTFHMHSIHAHVLPVQSVIRSRRSCKQPHHFTYHYAAVCTDAHSRLSNVGPEFLSKYLSFRRTVVITSNISAAIILPQTGSYSIFQKEKTRFSLFCKHYFFHRFNEMPISGMRMQWFVPV